MSDHNNRKFQRELPGEDDKMTVLCNIIGLGCSCIDSLFVCLFVPFSVFSFLKPLFTSTCHFSCQIL